ncbi:arginine/serine-rich coiled-coil protein 2 isoform X5 [Ostrinia nubilalis]|uniref:arginine/serine-rich coiled-coil protein 2 isoform X5 n=1 Tax=Ostrinia nubilalis TaxID=29057 RepID=UPI00308241C2
MDSLVGYGSDDENENERGGRHSSVAGSAGRRRDDDTNYDDVNMDMSEDSQAESEPELPPAEPAPERHSQARDDRRGSDDSRDRDRNRDRESDRRRRESPRRDGRPDRRDERPDRCDKNGPRSGRRGLLGERPPALMELRPFGGEPPPAERRPHDARDAASPRFVDRDRRDRDRERDRDRHGRRSEESRSHRHPDRRERSRSRERSRGAAFPPPSTSSSGERRGSPPSGDYRPSSYKVNKKLEVMEKMGLQIKTPDGSMATAQQLRAAAGDAPASSLPSYYNPGAANTSKILDQVQKRKLLWGAKAKAEAAAPAGQWTGARFAQDSDGRQASKFMRLMGIRDPEAVKAEKPPPSADPIKKQEELFQAMQAQYEVARATTHTMRGVGLGFSRSQY